MRAKFASAAAEPPDAEYRIVAVRGPLDPRGLESAGETLEIVIIWGASTVLHVAHLSPPRAFYLGEADADFVMPAGDLGAARLPLVRETNGVLGVVRPKGASLSITSSAGERLRASSVAGAHMFEAIAEGRTFRLPYGACARIELAQFTFLVRSVPAARRVGVRLALFEPHAWWVLVSALFHLGVFALFLLSPPIVPGVSLDRLGPVESARHFDLDVPLPEPHPSPSGAPPGVLAAPKSDAQVGGTARPRTGSRRFTVKGPRDHHDPKVGLAAMRFDAGKYGIIGLLVSAGDSLHAPSSLIGAENARGRDMRDEALAAMLGEGAGEDVQFGGLGMQGHGRGAGGDGDGTVGLGNIGTYGHGACGGVGSGYGSSSDPYHARLSKLPRVRIQDSDIFGSLSRDVIRRVMKRHASEVQQCYADALVERPELEGSVSIKFAISPTGAVLHSAVEHTDVNRPQLEACIADAVRRWVFPAPQAGGVVVVSHTFGLSTTRP